MDKTGEKGIQKNLKSVLIGISALIAVVCLIVVIFQIVTSFKPANSSIVVYKKNGDCIVRIDDKETIVSDDSAAGFKCDAESRRVFYTVDSAYSDGLCDLYYVEKKRSEITEPKMIDYGVEPLFEVVSDKVYYLKENEDLRANDGCVCDIDKLKIETYSNNVESVMALEGSDVVFFTKLHGNNRVLYKYSSGSPIEVCRDLVNVFRYNDCENSHILYEKKSAVNTGMTELYIAYSEGSPELICDNAYKVLYDEYVPDGNLYYFTSSKESVSWSYVIADQYEETDKTITRPNRADFFEIFGISVEYNKALREYQDKLVRDEIRDALNEAVKNGSFSAPIYTAFAYNKNGTFKIAENIDPQNVYSVSTHGEPKIIFESMEIVPSSTDMGALVSIAQRSSMAEVIKYARSVVDESISANGMAFAACGSEGAVSYPLSGYDRSKTMFAFSDDGKRIYAFVRDSQGERLNLYTNSFDSNFKPSAESIVDTGITSYRFVDGYVIYLKADIGKNTGDIFAYNGESNHKISNAANAFTVENDGDILILKNHNGQLSQPTADYYIYKEETEEPVAADAVVSSFNYQEGGKTAYICGTENGSLCIYSEGNTDIITEGVSEVLLFE